MRLRNCSLRRFEETFENLHWRKVIQMQPMRLCICSGRQFEKTFENSLWRNIVLCNQCDFATVHSDDLRKHLKTHTGEKSFKCNQCDYASVLAGSLRRHLKTRSGKKVVKVQPMWQCICSNMQFDNIWKLTPENKCNQCNFAFFLAGTLRRRLKIHSGEKSFKCNQWDYEFLLAGSVRRHLKTHSWAQLAHHHLFIHSGEKTHHFGSSLSQAGDLKKHLLIHTGEKPFKCAKCRFSSAESSGLNIGDGVFEVTPWERQCLSCRRWSWCASCLFCQQLVCRSPTGAAPSCLHPH